MEDELILSPANQAKLDAAIKKMRANNEPEQAIELVAKNFTREFGQSAAPEEELKKKYWRISITVGTFSCGFFVERFV